MSRAIGAEMKAAIEPIETAREAIATARGLSFSGNQSPANLVGVIARKGCPKDNITCPARTYRNSSLIITSCLNHAPIS